MACHELFFAFSSFLISGVQKTAWRLQGGCEECLWWLHPFHAFCHRGLRRQQGFEWKDGLGGEGLAREHQGGSISLRTPFLHSPEWFLIGRNWLLFWLGGFSIISGLEGQGCSNHQPSVAGCWSFLFQYTRVQMCTISPDVFAWKTLIISFCGVCGSPKNASLSGSATPFEIAPTTPRHTQPCVLKWEFQQAFCVFASVSSPCQTGTNLGCLEGWPELVGFQSWGWCRGNQGPTATTFGRVGGTWDSLTI